MRVLATPEAKDRVLHMRSLIGGPFGQQIADLHRDGARLSDPEVWDGPLAAQFRGLWTEVHQALEAAQRRLEELNRNIDAITTSIIEAGGG